MIAAARKATGLLVSAVLATAAAGCGSGDDTTSTFVTNVVAPDSGSDATTAPPRNADAGGPDVDRPEVGVSDSTTGAPVAMFSSASVDVGLVPCSGKGTAALHVQNTGTSVLALSVVTTGSVFSAVPISLTIPPGLDDGGSTGTLIITADVPGSSAAAIPLTGSLTLFTNDPARSNVTLPLSVTPSGATIVFQDATAVSFPTTGVNQAASALAVTLANRGNAPATVNIGAPQNPFYLTGSADGGGGPIDVGGTYSASFGFTPTDAALKSQIAIVTITGPTCGANVASISLTGQGALGNVTGYPTAPLDFGFADCGGSAPAPEQFLLTNTGPAAAHVTKASISGPGFITSAAVGQVIPGGGGTLLVNVNAPAVPNVSSLTPIAATLTLQTDADTSAQTIALTEEPHGAVLVFDTSANPTFGSFGQSVLLQATSQNFSVKNTGTGAAVVTLSAGTTGSAPAPFTVSNPSFSIPAAGAQTDAVIFAPTAANNAGSLSMNATGTLCAPLPSSLPLSGAGVGAGPSINPTSLTFPAFCGGPPPAPATFTVRNDGQANLNWSMSPVTGAGSERYTLSASPAPGLLMPGKTSTVTVTAAAIPSPTPNPRPSSYTSHVTITTDVPFDNPHTVTLGETPLGDVLSVSRSNLSFGQFPIGTSTIAQTFVVTNDANLGSPAATLSISPDGSGASAYSIAPATIGNLAPGGGVSGLESVTFRPGDAIPYQAKVALASTDRLCSPLPPEIQLMGTGTQGKVSVSATTLAFGTDANDPGGLVNCGSTGLAHTFTISNIGNQLFNVTGLSLGLGAMSPYVVSGDAATLPAAAPIGASLTVTVTPKAIPANVTNPNDATPFTDTLTVSTDAALDAPHRVALVMQARGAVITDTPLATTWDFGTLGNGRIGTFSSTVTNTGNADASIAFSGLTNPTIFGLQGSPTTIVANDVTDIMGQFSPPATNQVWTDHGTLVVTPAQVFCEPLPAAWNRPAISLSGSSIGGSLPVTVSGNLAFPTTDCGSAGPAAQSITLTNTTAVPYVYTAALSYGAFYTLQNPTQGDAGAGIIVGHGVVVLGVTPVTVAPGPGVVAGSAPYADNLVIAIQSQTPSGVTLPISWTLNGAMLSLPEGMGPNKDSTGNQFYVADSQSGLTLPMDNSGTATASVQFGIQPLGAFTVTPTPPIAIEPNIRALPRLSSASADAACPALTAGSATFLYSGPVCRPFQFPKITIQSCAGAF